MSTNAVDEYLKLKKRLELLPDYISEEMFKRGHFAKLAKEYNIPINTLYMRVKNLKWDLEKALTTPIQKHRRKNNG